MAKQDKKDHTTKEIELIIKMLKDFREKYKLNDYQLIDISLILNRLQKLK